MKLSFNSGESKPDFMNSRATGFRVEYVPMHYASSIGYPDPQPEEGYPAQLAFTVDVWWWWFSWVLSWNDPFSEEYLKKETPPKRAEQEEGRSDNAP